LAETTSETVGSEYQYRTHHALDQASRRGDAPLATDNSVIINVGVQYLACLRAYEVPL
jgi:hypothetical protein